MQELAWLLSRLKSRVSAKQFDEKVNSGINLYPYGHRWNLRKV